MKVTYLRMNPKRRFGVELEMTQKIGRSTLSRVVSDALIKRLPNRAYDTAICTAEGWHTSINNSNWTVKTDSTCGDRGGRGNEVVSRVGYGATHLKDIAAVARALSAAGVQLNDRCGLHCHVEMDDYGQDQASVLLAYWCKIEKLMSHSVPKGRMGSTYCKYQRKRPAFKALMSSIEKGDSVGTRAFWNKMKLTEYTPASKRTSLTLANYEKTKSYDYSFNRPTAEFRFPEGTVCHYDAKNWARLFVNFVDTCRTKHFPKNFDEVNSIDELLEILGLRSSDSFAILSPGLFETKMWLLYRLFKNSSSKSIRAATTKYSQRLFLPGMRWRFDFPLISTSGIIVRPPSPKKKSVKKKRKKSYQELDMETIERIISSDRGNTFYPYSSAADRESDRNLDYESYWADQAWP